MDGAVSESVEFRYKPCNNQGTNRKRPRFIGSYYESEIPLVVPAYNSPESYVPQCVDIPINTDDSNLSEISDLLNSNGEFAIDYDGMYIFYLSLYLVSC